MFPCAQGREIKCENISNGIKSQGPYKEMCLWTWETRFSYIFSFCEMERKKLRTDAK